MKNNLAQSIITAVLIILLVVIWNPFKLWMPDMMLISILIVLLIVFGLFASLVLREKAGDEREAVHRMLAGRAAFLSGSVVLLLAIISQAFSHNVDIWLVATLVIMIVVKMIARLYSDKNM